MNIMNIYYYAVRVEHHLVINIINQLKNQKYQSPNDFGIRNDACFERA